MGLRAGLTRVAMLSKSLVSIKIFFFVEILVWFVMEISCFTISKRPKWGNRSPGTRIELFLN